MRTNKVEEIINKLDEMELSQNARDVINNTDLNTVHELFGNLDTEEEVEELIKEIMA